MNGLEPVSFADAPFEIIDGDRGKNYPKREEFSASGHCLFLSATNVTKSGFNFSECQFIDEKRDAALNKGKLRREDVVLTTRGTLGNTAYFNDAVPFNHLRINSGMVILRCDRTKLLPAFLYHFVRSPSFHSQVNGLRSGVAQPQLPIQDMRKIGLPVPSLPVQQRIASILSAYDELIENSQRRIKILESMARGLYREWFVHFRFPGHESHPRVASALGEIPKGWEVKKFGDAVELNYGKALKKEDRREGEYPVFGSSGIVGTHDSALVKGPGIIVGRKGNVGSVFWCNEDFFVIDTAYFVTSSLPLRFLLYVLPTLNFINSDAAVPGLSRNQAYTLDILISPPSLLEKFCELADAFEQQAATLQRQIQNLRSTRDLLLPRLLSGQIEVDRTPDGITT
jgi:type I restriction enzyme S subunit